ncbi:MAG: hypothetical protein ACOYZ8_17945 [Chloroflexota bacterium]
MPNRLPSLWTRHSSILLGGFFLVIFLIVYIWWPLAEEYLAYVDWDGPWWLYMDWLLLGIFGFTSLTIVARADLKADALIVFVGTCGGLAIESWGTQTNLWHYYTAERPPLWIIPAWPIASLSIDRITRFINFGLKSLREALWKSQTFERAPVQSLETLRQAQDNALDSVFRILYWFTFVSFLALMLVFVAPTSDKSYTWLATILCVLLILTPTDYRYAFLTFAAGTGLGYFLELWGTTRECWTYYTYQTPPLFAVLAHGMAAVTFWRAGLVVNVIGGRFRAGWTRQAKARPERSRRVSEEA